MKRFFVNKSGKIRWYNPIVYPLIAVCCIWVFVYDGIKGSIGFIAGTLKSF